MYYSSTFSDGHVLLLYSFFPVLWIQGFKKALKPPLFLKSKKE